MAMAKPGPDPLIDAVAGELTSAHADAVRTLLAQSEVAAGDVAVIGFHGHTVAHTQDTRWTWQVGDGEALARMTGTTDANCILIADSSEASRYGTQRVSPLISRWSRYV